MLVKQSERKRSQACLSCLSSLHMIGLCMVVSAWQMVSLPLTHCSASASEFNTMAQSGLGPDLFHPLQVIFYPRVECRYHGTEFLHLTRIKQGAYD